MLSLFSSTVLLVNAYAELTPLEDAIWFVESSRCTENCPAGDNQKSRGPLQIQEIAFDTVKKDGESYDMVEDLHFSVQIFRRTMKRFVTEKRLGRVPTDRDRSMCWNGGGSWFKGSKKKQQRLQKYWLKVKKELEK